MLEGLSDDQWQTMLDGEGWPIRVGACHVAEHYNNLWQLVDIAANAKPIPDWAPKGPRRHRQAERRDSRPQRRPWTPGSARYAALERDECRGATENFSDEQLDRKFILPTGGEFTADQIAQMMLVGHTGMHVPSIQQATGAKA